MTAPMPSIESSVADFAMSLAQGLNVVDVGCGLQPYRPLFMHTKYVGIDVETSGRTAETKQADLYFDGINIPLESHSIDAVLCTEVLEHAVDPERLMGEIFRILRPGGRLCLTVPFIWGLHELPYDFRRFTPFGLEKMVSEQGFVVERQEKLTIGTSAILKLIGSEVNNFLVNVAPTQKMTPTEMRWFRFKVLCSEQLLRALARIWNSTLRFERVYIDNLLIAYKPKLACSVR